MWVCTLKADNIPPECTTKISTKTITVTSPPVSVDEAVQQSRNPDCGHKHIQIQIP